MPICTDSRDTPVFGNMAWGERSGASGHGRLTAWEKGRILGNLIRMSGLEMVDGVAATLKLTSVYGADLDGLLPPTSRLVSDSLDLAGESLSGEIFQHSWRTYYWGMLLAGYRGLDVDREILFSAALLHDLGLAHDRPVPPRKCCFALHGAQRAKSHLISKGHDRKRARKIGDAIALHLNGYVSDRVHGVEAHLLSRGAMCDVFGLGSRRIAGRTRKEVSVRHPKGDLMTSLEVWPGHHLSGTRADFLIRLKGPGQSSKSKVYLQQGGD